MVSTSQNSEYLTEATPPYVGDRRGDESLKLHSTSDKWDINTMNMTSVFKSNIPRFKNGFDYVNRSNEIGPGYYDPEENRYI